MIATAPDARFTIGCREQWQPSLAARRWRQLIDRWRDVSVVSLRSVSFSTPPS